MRNPLIVVCIDFPFAGGSARAKRTRLRNDKLGDFCLSLFLCLVAKSLVFAGLRWPERSPILNP